MYCGLIEPLGNDLLGHFICLGYGIGVIILIEIGMPIVFTIVEETRMNDVDLEMYLD